MHALRYLIPVLVLSLSTVTAAAAEAVAVAVRDGYVRLPPPGSPAAAYFTLVNTGADRVLVDADCGCAGMTMIHETVEQDGMARMRHVDGAKLPSGGALTLKPGGMHVMLMRLQAPLKLGDQVSLLLHFADGDTLTIVLPVESR